MVDSSSNEFLSVYFDDVNGVHERTTHSWYAPCGRVNVSFQRTNQNYHCPCTGKRSRTAVSSENGSPHLKIMCSGRFPCTHVLLANAFVELHSVGHEYRKMLDLNRTGLASKLITRLPLHASLYRIVCTDDDRKTIEAQEARERRSAERRKKQEERRSLLRKLDLFYAEHHRFPAVPDKQ